MLFRSALDAVLFTHDHADHTHGIDDLRMVAYAMKRRVPCYFDAVTQASIVGRFAYCFVQPEGSTYPPILSAERLVPGEPIRVVGGGGPIEALPIKKFHGDIESVAFRFDNVAYSPEVSALPLDSVPLLEDLDLWIVDALRYTPHPSHFSVKEALEHVTRLRARRAVLTHMTGDLDYAALKRELPAHVEPAYDNMVIEV